MQFSGFEASNSKFMGCYGLGMGVHVMSVHSYECSCHGWLLVYVVHMYG
jgi:hypothetical protein